MRAAAITLVTALHQVDADRVAARISDGHRMHVAGSAFATARAVADRADQLDRLCGPEADHGLVVTLHPGGRCPRRRHAARQRGTVRDRRRPGAPARRRRAAGRRRRTPALVGRRRRLRGRGPDGGTRRVRDGDRPRPHRTAVRPSASGARVPAAPDGAPRP
ncbi:hypothetical protein Q9Q99_07725 [Curtobacterium flaccumfaciens]|nr:hypothetical protein Q9Q99_07725 [Curtobacterium flaccumfaciens]